ncbi:MAG: ABC transporter permease [SAR202 cluster bacterium]|nr:ABC transporter permease [SAR202 cluster bacterium]
MTTQAGPSITVSVKPAVGKWNVKRLWANTWRGAKRNPNMAYGIGIVVFMALLAIFADLLWTETWRPNPLSRFTSPTFSGGHWFGTDNIGRDVYSGTIYGARVSLLVAASVSAIAIGSGGVLGIVAGYFRRSDMFIMRFVDGLMSIPSILLAMALMALLGGSVQNVIIALSVTEAPIAVRIVRSAVLSVREMTYVDAARAIGARSPRILFRHIMPNIVAPLIVQGTFIASAAVLLEAYLSFLGAGTPPEVPSWGIIMAESQKYITRAVWVILFPGIFLTLTVLGISLAGDGLRDNLDPRLRRRM